MHRSIYLPFCLPVYPSPSLSLFLYLSIDLSVCLSSFYLSIHPSIHPSVYLSTIIFHIYHFLSLFLTISHCLSWSNIICHSLSWSIIIMHHLSLLSIYTYLKLSIIIHLFLYLSFYRSILSYPILSCPAYPILSYLSYLSYWVLQKKTQPSSYRLSHHTWSPRAPLINVDCPIRTEIAVFWRPFQAKRGNNIELGERGHASFFAMRLTGWLLFLKNPVSILSCLSILCVLSIRSILSFLSNLSISLSIPVYLSTYLYIYRLFILYMNCIYLNYQPSKGRNLSCISKLSILLFQPMLSISPSNWFASVPALFFYLSTWSS